MGACTRVPSRYVFKMQSVTLPSCSGLAGEPGSTRPTPSPPSEPHATRRSAVSRAPAATGACPTAKAWGGPALGPLGTQPSSLCLLCL